MGEFWLGVSLTLILSSEDKDPVAGDNLELVLLGRACHLDDGEWDHPLRVWVLEWVQEGGCTPEPCSVIPCMGSHCPDW